MEKKFLKRHEINMEVRKIRNCLATGYSFKLKPCVSKEVI